MVIYESISGVDESQETHSDEYLSRIRFLIGNWNHSVRNKTNGSNALGRNRIHDKHSPGLILREDLEARDVLHCLVGLRHAPLPSARPYTRLCWGGVMKKRGVEVGFRTWRPETCSIVLSSAFPVTIPCRALNPISQHTRSQARFVLSTVEQTRHM